jgi:hypothetical protein
LRCSNLEDVCERDLESTQQRCDPDVVGFGRELDGPIEPVCAASVDSDHIDLRIDDPVFDDAGRS